MFAFVVFVLVCQFST